MYWNDFEKNVIDVYDSRIIEWHYPPLIIQYVHVPCWDCEMERSRFYIGLFIKYTRTGTREYIYPCDYECKNPVHYINSLIGLRNDIFIKVIRQAYSRKEDILLIDPEGKRRIICWAEYEKVFSKCEFYRGKPAPASVVDLSGERQRAGM